MILKGKVVWIHDIEIFPNLFIDGVLNTETEELITFEVSDRKNNIAELINFYNDCSNKYICGYNVIHYDNPIINLILDKQQQILKGHPWTICDNLFQFSNMIINSKDHNFSEWSKWKYANNFDTLDLLTMLFSQKLRVGLKEMQVTMQFGNVQEYDGDFSKPCPIEDIDNVIKYNINDLKSTEELLNRCKKQIDLRLGIEEEFGVNVLNKDGMSIGMEILKIKYLQRTGKTWAEIKDLRTPCDVIDLNKVILPFIRYDNPVLQDLLTEMKGQVVSPGRKGYEKHFLLDNVEVTVGVGGIHTRNDPETIIPNEEQVLLDSDVNSLYPSLLMSYSFIPPHLGKEFLEIYGQIRKDRLIAKRTGQKIKNETYKLALNGLTGNLQNEYSWVYSPFTVMQIRINGQLLLLMLAEKILEAGGKIKQLNTDGILYLFDKHKLDELNQILSDWEKTTRLTLETDEFEAFYQYAINDYLAITKGYKQKKIEFEQGNAVNSKGVQYTSLDEIRNDYFKKKGLFISTVNLGKGMNAMVIPKAICLYLADKIPVEETVYGDHDINDFITYQKVSRDFKVEYNNQLITHINRYYVSTTGPYLYKCKVDSEGNRFGYINMLCASGVTIVNNLEDLSEFPKDVNYPYYIKAAKDIIAPFKLVQLSLF